MAQDALGMIETKGLCALLEASVMLGATLAGASARELTILETYGERIGLAFQITDDILDIECDTATLGKPQGSDQKHAKLTYPALLGLERARALAREQHAAALESLRPLGDNGRLLGEIANFILDRTH